MSKKKPANSDDDPLLPFGNGDEKSADPTPAPIEEAVPADIAPEPEEKKSEKVQDEEAPLAVNYRNWFLDARAM